ncbi:hypothetical protein [Candidatus Poriferisodalis sp.]|uniref:hypothetical protein n=1 Tax=Candidatus Poriferisodalis sp. TaxID=3101277 RepID=UPI003B0234E0
MPEGKLHEHDFNAALAEAMKRMHADNRIAFRHERVGVLKPVAGGSSRRVDVLVSAANLLPVAVEVEYDRPGAQPDRDAAARLGLELATDGRVIESAISVLAPRHAEQWKDHSDAVSRLVGGAPLQYAVLSRTDDPDEPIRWPRSGWLSGTAQSLAELAVMVSVPPGQVELVAADAADKMRGISEDLDTNLSDDAKLRLAIAMGRPSGSDSLNVVGVVWLNAFLFQDRIAQSHEEVPTRSEAAPDHNPIPQLVAQAWEAIRAIDYRSVFDPATAAMGIVEQDIGTALTAGLLGRAALMADRVESGVLGLFDIGGELFQRLISDRSEAASYYTRPEVAEFLAHITVNESVRLPQSARALALGESDHIGEVFRIADFACGTGTLLRAAYRRVRSLARSAGAQPLGLAALHTHLMEEGFCGVDISPIAAHLTASGLSNIEPGADYRHTNIGVARACGPRGATGSVEYLQTEYLADLFGYEASTTGAAPRAGAEADAQGLYAPNERFDIVMMNPPYSRSRGGQALFDIAGATEAERKRAQQRAATLVRDTPANLKAGLAAVFCELARLKLSPGGRVGMVLPITAAASPAWSDIRAMFETHFDDLLLVAFPGATRGGDKTLSADTAMGEMIIAGTKRSEPRADLTAAEIMTVALDEPFGSIAVAAETGRSVDTALRGREEQREGNVTVGTGVTGRWTVLPAADGGPWAAVGAASFGAVAVAERLTRRGEFMPLDAHEPVCRVAMTTIGELFELGPTHHRIGHVAGNEPIGAFELWSITDDQVRPDTSLWASDAEAQTTLTVDPTHYGHVVGPRLSDARERALVQLQRKLSQTNGGKPSDAAIEKAQAEAEAAERARSQDAITEMRRCRSTLFYQRGIFWPSQVALAAVTDKLVMGGRAWCALLHDDPIIRFAFAIWANSTLGMVVHWSRAQRQQHGRSSAQLEGIRQMPCPNFNEPSTYAAARELLETEPELLRMALMPARDAYRDTARAAVDDAAARLLGIPDSESLRDLANNWCCEPSVHDGTPPVFD